MEGQAQWTMRLSIFIVISSVSCSVFFTGVNAVEITNMTAPKNVVVCSNVTVLCQVRPPSALVWWALDEKNITQDGKRWSVETIHDEVEDVPVANVSLHIVCVQFTDAGNYSCHALNPSADDSGSDAEPVQTQYRFVNVVVPAEVVSQKSARAKVDKEAILECGIKGYPLRDVHWQKAHDIISISDLKNITKTEYSNDSYAYTKLKFPRVTRKDNGTYYCKADGPLGTTEAAVPLFVLDTPQLNIDFVKAVGSRRIFLNWTVNDWNEPVQEYYMQHMKNNTGAWTYYQEQIRGGNTSYVLQNLEPNTPYKFKFSAKNSQGQGNTYEVQEWVTTLDSDPNFTPEITVEGLTSNSISIQWTTPPPAIGEHVHYYHLHLSNENTLKEAIQEAKNGMNVFLFGQLKPNTVYHFKVAACSYYTKQCGNWSKTVEGRTTDGTSSAPENVTITCKFDNVSYSTFVMVTWSPPLQPNGEIVHYNVQLLGKATFSNERGIEETMTWGPKVKRIDAKLLSARFTSVPPNTNYTVTISGVTRVRNEGIEAKATCLTPPTVPDKDKLMRVNWGKVEEHGRWMFKLFLPRISERNGPICCYRVYVVKLPPHQGVSDLPTPEEFPVSSFLEVQQSPQGGAYVAEMFESVPTSTEVIVGDGRLVERNASGSCQRCLAHRRRAVYVTPSSTVASSASSLPDVTAPLAYIPSLMSTASPPPPPLPPASTPSPPSPKLDDAPGELPQEEVTEATEGRQVRRRRAENVAPLMPYLSTIALPTVPPPPEPSSPSSPSTPEAPLLPAISVTVPCGGGAGENCSLPVYDGHLDMNSNYTGFLEVIVMGSQAEVLTAYSSYFVVLNPGPQVLQAVDSTAALVIALQVICALMLVVVVLLATLCLLQRYNKQVAESQGVELSIRTSFRHLYRSLRGRHVLVAAQPPDMAPISSADLPSAYAERHKDSDYGFQHEFELLPVRFPDRTTNASECSMYKNRYPDIKAYDQTRVKLAQVDSIVGSDYINANFVVGYKERKKFICAQGPMENTLSDFWRMIWEQHLEMVLMLTNLEEYSKTKCAKYWPDTGESKTYGEISVNHVTEKRESEYIIRELQMTRSSGTENRRIIQYHFLVWKDFQAPEHPAGILKYIRRVNEAYSLEKGPILIHCSAGVGRTGTLVALDSLLQQLAEERQVAIFNTICDLRHQRNFLVQSLKQYIFVYRTLVEMAQFGDTELNLSRLKSAVEWLRQRDNGQTKTRMEEEFEKISGALEEQKSTSVGSADENSGKNRTEAVIPYDRNRVILTPIPGKEHSTYINASFTEGYDNSESFVITQDPLECTVADFWRMLSEQCVSTLVMLTDVSRPSGLRSQGQGSGDGAKESSSPQTESDQAAAADVSKKCLRYWPEPDDETTYDHIRVRYIQSESCPYYTRREFAVINTKTDDNTMVTQFHYHGWPTVEGEVPEVTRGLIELVDQSQTNQAAQQNSGPIVVHCGCGSERSSMFVALSILVQQLRTEKRVDVCTTTRKLRSQRQGMIQAFAQYEFLHRAIINYADLHNLYEETD